MSLARCKRRRHKSTFLFTGAIDGDWAGDAKVEDSSSEVSVEADRRVQERRLVVD